MLMISGMAVDFMRNENIRVHLQNTIDRSVLAAADMDQQLVPEDVVASYFEKAGLADFLDEVVVTENMNTRQVTARASAKMSAMFLRLVGIDHLDAPAGGTASEQSGNVEISLVVDISGSMGWPSTQGGIKINHLRDAANDFVDTMLDPLTEDYVSISLVPYTAQVNAGPDIYNELNMETRHLFSHCVEFEAADFSTTAIDLDKTYQQGQHFEWSSAWYNNYEIQYPGCPQEVFERITPLSQSVTDLQTQISALVPRANTAIHYGMKWGVALLDPALQPVIRRLANGNGPIDRAFRDRPADWGERLTKKFVVLMTDGQNVPTYRISDWAYNSPSEYIFWDRYTLWRYLYDNIAWNNRSDFYYEKYSASDADAMLATICTAAKDAGIIVYTVGFEVNDHAANVMENCASSENHFFRVEGVEISSAFAAIARDITQLKLTQ